MILVYKSSWLSGEISSVVQKSKSKHLAPYSDYVFWLHDLSNGLVTRMTQECPKTFSGDISPGSILVRYWYTWDVPRKKIISTWQLHRRSSRHCLIGVRNVSRRSQEGLFGLFHPGSDPGTAWDAPGMHPSRNKSTHSVLSVIYWIQCLGTVWSRSWVSK